MVYHLNLHKGIKPYVCNVCNKRFYQQANLNSHKRRHCDDRPHICDVCQKGFPSESLLTKHRLCHLKKKKERNKEAVAQGFDSVFNVIISSDLLSTACSSINTNFIDQGSITYKTSQAAHKQQESSSGIEASQSFPSSVVVQNGTSVIDTAPQNQQFIHCNINGKTTESQILTVLNTKSNSNGDEGNPVEVPLTSFITLPGESKTNNRVVSANVNTEPNHAAQLLSVLLPVVVKSVPPKTRSPEASVMQQLVSNESPIILNNGPFLLLNSVPSGPVTMNSKVESASGGYSQFHVPVAVQLNVDGMNNCHSTSTCTSGQPTIDNKNKSIVLSSTTPGDDVSSLICELCNKVMPSIEHLKEHLTTYHRVAVDNINLQKGIAMPQVLSMDCDSTTPNMIQQQLIHKDQFASMASTQVLMQACQPLLDVSVSHNQELQPFFIDQPITDLLPEKVVALPFSQIEDLHSTV